jgi:membrane protease YdiL (CAAX protease family)
MEATIQSNINTKYIVKSVLFCGVFIGLLIVLSFAKGFIPNDFERLAHGVIGTLAALLTTILFLKIDRKRFSDIGLTFERNTLVKFFVGVITGIVIMGLLATGVIYFTNLSIEANRSGSLLHFLLVTAPVLPLAFMEELAFRAYPLQILKNKIGIRLSIVVTSILFALYHIVNGWTIASIFLGPAIWGLIFGLAAIYSRGIGLPTGIHYAANLTTAAFGAKNYPVSIWTIKQSNHPTATYWGIDWATILPAFALLVFAITFIEAYMRRKTAANSPLAQAELTEEQSAIVR